MPTFRKYSFDNQNTADKLLKNLQPLDHAVHLGVIDGLVCVDIMWHDQADSNLDQYIVWPTPLGVHCFFGWDEQYTQDFEKFNGNIDGE
jgi:hypothetical protein